MPEMRQLNDGTWLNEETGVAVAPGDTYFTGQDRYTGPPLLPTDVNNPTPPPPAQQMNVVLPPIAPPQMEQPVAGFSMAGDGMKKMMLVVGIVALTYFTVWGKNKINGKKKK